VCLSPVPPIESVVEDRECLVASQGIGEVTEVDEVDEFFRCHLG
jgi:hypothetical protein